MSITTTDESGKEAINARFSRWPLYYKQAHLSTTLYRALARANQKGEAVLASFVFPVEPCDALCILQAFEQLQLRETFFWEQPGECKSLVGAGVATKIETCGGTRFASTAAAWQVLQREAIVEYAPKAVPGLGGPILVGGFAFDPLHPGTSLWRNFPDGLHILPAFLFHSQGQQATFTINQVVPVGGHIDALVDRLVTSLQLLQYYVESHLSSAAPSPIYHNLIIQDLLAPQIWQCVVTNTVQSIQQGAYHKVVLARGVKATLPSGETFDILAVLKHLRQHYPSAYIFSIQRGEHYFCGATPERLAQVQSGHVYTMALAGSSPRGEGDFEDQCLGSQLLHSEKNLKEHALVVTMIRETLQALCSDIRHADAPTLLLQKNIQHLCTTIVGTLRPKRSIFDVVAALHPTPAVGGFPQREILAVIREKEHLDRGWYAGPIGWVGPDGDGEFAVALRSALVARQYAVLFAGCGIVADSKAEEEYRETGWKLEVMMSSLRGGLV